MSDANQSISPDGSPSVSHFEKKPWQTPSLTQEDVAEVTRAGGGIAGDGGISEVS